VVVALRDVIVLTGRGCGMDMEFLVLLPGRLVGYSREVNKHSSSIFVLRFSHAKIFSRWFHPSIHKEPAVNIQYLSSDETGFI